jgi:hypothetical protein
MQPPLHLHPSHPPTQTGTVPAPGWLLVRLPVRTPTGPLLTQHASWASMPCSHDTGGCTQPDFVGVTRFGGLTLATARLIGFKLWSTVALQVTDHMHTGLGQVPTCFAPYLPSAKQVGVKHSAAAWLGTVPVGPTSTQSRARPGHQEVATSPSGAANGPTR